jgi:deazaflavin-dependent oxidoreductase (nitroreductase family)
MPSDGLLKVMNSAHRVLLKVTFGKVGWKMGPMPVLELTTTGRKSGQPRSVMLTSPIQEGDDLVIVASKGGEDTHPAWYLNLRDRPDVQVALAGKAAQPYTATVVPDDERDVLWPQIERTYKGYAGYQKKTDRKIPLVRLSPRA